MPNTEVKLLHAESSWWETACEDRKLPREGKVRPEGLAFLFCLGRGEADVRFLPTGGRFLIISLKIDSTIVAILIIGNSFTQLPAAF